MDLAPKAPRQRVGIYGGTFDPVHVGHLIVAEEARAQLGLERVLFVPASVSPLKLGQVSAPAADRLAMVRLAIADNPALSISEVDLRRSGPSFTVETLASLRRELGNDVQLYYVMGVDSLLTLAKWRDPHGIIERARLAVISRPGFGVDWSDLERQVPGIREATELIDSLRVGISSTDIRARLRDGRTIRYQVPSAVEEYIRQRGLYR